MKMLLALAAGLLAALALAACGSSSDGTASAGNAANDRDTARLKLQDCLRTHGVDLPTPGGGGLRGNPPSAATRAKMQAALRGPCKGLAQGAFGNVTAEQRQEFQDAFAKFASCMRSKGVEVPSFTPGQGPPAGGARIDPNDPKVRSAMQTCRSNLPQGGRFGGPGGGAAQ